MGEIVITLELHSDQEISLRLFAVHTEPVRPNARTAALATPTSPQYLLA